MLFIITRGYDGPKIVFSRFPCCHNVIGTLYSVFSGAKMSILGLKFRRKPYESDTQCGLFLSGAQSGRAPNSRIPLELFIISVAQLYVCHLKRHEKKPPGLLPQEWKFLDKQLWGLQSDCNRVATPIRKIFPE